MGSKLERAVSHRRWWVLALLLLASAVALWVFTPGAVRLLAALPCAGYWVLTSARDRWKEQPSARPESHDTPDSERAADSAS